MASRTVINPLTRQSKKTDGCAGSYWLGTEIEPVESICVCGVMTPSVSPAAATTGLTVEPGA